MRRYLTMLLMAVGVAVAVAGGGARAATVVRTGNLVTNGGAEVGPSGTDASAVVAPQGWTTTGNFTAVIYGGAGGLPDLTASAAIHGGKSMFAGGPDNASSAAVQTATVPASWAGKVATGHVKASVSADLGGWDGQPDAATVRYDFLSATGTVLGSVKIGPVSSTRRGNVTELLPVSGSAMVPAATRSVRITISAIRGSGAYNDGYADNIALRLVA